MSLNRSGHPYRLTVRSGSDRPGMPSKGTSGGTRSQRRIQRRGEGLIAPPPFGIPASGRRGAAQAEALARLVERHLEELQFSFDREPLDDVAGFLIAEGPYRAIVAARDLDAPARLRLYFHCLGHLALGHVDDHELTLSYEFRDRWRLLPAEQAREAAADAWADSLLATLAAPPSTSPRYQPGLRRALRNLRVPRGYARACLARLRAALEPAPAEGVAC